LEHVGNASLLCGLIVYHQGIANQRPGRA